LRKGKQGRFPAGTKVVSKNLDNTRVGRQVRLPEQHHDGIQISKYNCSLLKIV
jgi:hypothetical protein